MQPSESYDVIVVGGGSAGLAAGLSAARNGAKTLLLERQASLGGMGTNALVHTFCGLFHPDVSSGPRWLNPGIPTEIGEQMLKLTGQTTPDLMGRVYVLRQHPSVLATLANDLCNNESNLSVWTEVELTKVQQHSQHWSFTVVSRGNKHSITSKALVDGSGDALIARLLGSEFYHTTPPEHLYRPAYICSFQGMRDSLDDTARLRLASVIVHAVKDGHLPQSALGASFRNSPLANEVFLTVDLEAGQGAWNPLDPVKCTQVETEGRETVQALLSYLREHHVAFRDITPPSLPAQAGVRESTRWKGDYVLTGSDLIRNRRFENEAALAGWPLEKRETAQGPKFQFFDKAEPAGIPFNSLRNSSLPGIFFCGRCLSCDHEALASVRVMGTCLATGQAAGQMAAAFSQA